MNAESLFTPKQDAELPFPRMSSEEQLRNNDVRQELKTVSNEELDELIEKGLTPVDPIEAEIDEAFDAITRNGKAA